jgi:hypothetical protein
VAAERIPFADGETDDMPSEMAEFMIRELFRTKRRQFASLARSYYLALHGGIQETAEEEGGEPF